MNKYKLENNINFYDELYKSLDEEEVFDDERCLITNEKLTDKFVKLNCGHKFNYIPLYNDLVNYKNKYIHLEFTSNYLNFDEIRCPYCRSKQTGLLPYYEELQVKKIHGVNYVDETLPIFKLCSFLTPNVGYAPNYPNSPQHFKCQYQGYKIEELGEDFKDDNYYCFKHKKLIIQKYKQDKKLKQKQEQDKINAEKMKIKEEKMKLKEEKIKIKEEKMKLKEEKLKQKEENKNTKKNKDNIVLGPINIILEEPNINTEETNQNNLEEIQCIEILKTGPNKGNKCCNKAFKNQLCKRHFNLKEKLQNNLNNDINI